MRHPFLIFEKNRLRILAVMRLATRTRQNGLPFTDLKSIQCTNPQSQQPINTFV